MKKAALVVPFFALVAYITFSSHMAGYTTNVTGSDGTSAIGCGGYGCHGTLPTAGIVDSILLDSAGTGNMVSQYTPGKSYIIRFQAINTISGSALPSCGFQLSVVKGSSYTDAGILDTIPGTTKFGSGISILVQTDCMACDTSTGAGGMGTVYRVSVPWTAPAAGTGAVKIYGVMNAVNEDSAATVDDKWNTKNITINERTLGIEKITETFELKVFPNPVLSDVNIQLINAATGQYEINVFDMSGKLVIRKEVEVNGNNMAISMEHFSRGLYQMVIQKDGVSATVALIKQ